MRVLRMLAERVREDGTVVLTLAEVRRIMFAGWSPPDVAAHGEYHLTALAELASWLGVAEFRRGGDGGAALEFADPVPDVDAAWRQTVDQTASATPGR